MEDLKKHPNLKAFIQHGFTPSEVAQNQVKGNCIFCGKKDHFYVNPEKKMWDCKVCGRSGGFISFLTELVKWGAENFKGKPAIELSRDRGIKLETLRHAEVGYNTINKSYLIPVYNSEGDKIWDVRKFEKTHGLYSTSGCTAALYNWQHAQHADTIWLCEGHWDALAAMQYVDMKKTVAVGVPGAGTFKAEWAAFFAGKTVYCVYDNDKAGFEGMIKVYNTISSNVKELTFIQWPEGTPEGYDLRDYQKEHKNIKGILAMMDTTPPGVDDIPEAHVNESHEGVLAEQVYEGYRKFLHIDDTTIIDVMFGTVIANRIDGDPLWMFIVAPPGGYKTEMLMSLSDAPKISTTTSLTPPSLISGCNFAGGADPSLIPRLNNKVLIIKDFTTILNMNQTMRDEVFGILRDAYDGKTEKHFGNGVFRSYESKFGILAGVTPAIELYLEGNAAMGERFLGYKTPISDALDDRRTILKRAVSNVGNEVQMRADLRDTARRVLLYDFKERPTVPVEIEDKILDLAQWVAMMRGTVNRDRYTKEITHKPFAELGTRLAKQFFKLLLGVTMFRRKQQASESEFLIVKNIGLGTLPGRLEEFTRIIYRRFKDRPFDADKMAEITGLPRVTCQRVIEDLTMLGIFEKKKKSTIQTEWFYRSSILNLMEGARVYA
jgi:hypothetical protein